MSEEVAQLSPEDLYKRHREERKDLQSQIQVIKKNATKGDKKKKKEAAEAIARLEFDLERKHEAELQRLQPYINMEQSIFPTVEQENPDTDTTPDAEVELNLVEQSVNKVSRAQKRRNKKQVADKEREKRIEEQEEINRDGPRSIEINTIKTILESEGLKIHNIPADGNCLYCAINHQLEVTERTILSVPKLRKLTANFMRDNKEEFLPFMHNEDDDIMDDDGFEKYCKDVASTKLWGGQIELTALSNILQCPIKIIQASGPSTLQGEEFLGPPLILTYHKHLYRLGEHYNSTIKLDETDEINENGNVIFEEEN